MRRQTWKSALLALPALLLLACGSDHPIVNPTRHAVTLSWAANREKGVNQAGGGYRVSIPGQPDVDLPWVSGPSAPTSTDVTLWTGTYQVTVRAYQALDAQGGATGSTSPPAVLTVVVP